MGTRSSVMEKLSVLLLFFLGGYVMASGPRCEVPPSLWCSSLDSARRCMVEKQCAAFRRRQARGDRPVEVGVYYSSLSPDSIAFIKGQLYPTWSKVQSIMNLTLVPYGKSNESTSHVPGEWLFSCQYGKDDCSGNIVETCVIDKFKPNTALDIIHCMSNSESPPKAGKQCTEKFSTDYGPAKECWDSWEEGSGLEHQMALKTDALDPPLNSVPWITLYGVHTDDIQKKAESNLLALVCSSYHGSAAVPPDCQNVFGQRIN